MTEDRRDRPSRGWADDADSPAPRSGYPEWPLSGDATADDAAPTNVYAALSDLAPRDAEVSAPGADDPGHGEPVPRDFAPPQSPWTTESDIGGSRVRLTPGPAPLDPADLDAQSREPQGMYGHPPAAEGYGGNPYFSSGGPADVYGRAPGVETTGSHRYPEPGLGGDATDPYGRSAGDVAPDGMYGRPPARGGETFDSAWAARAGGAATAAGYGDQGFEDPAAGYGDRIAGFERPVAAFDDQGGQFEGPAAGYGGPSAGYEGSAPGYEGTAAGYDGSASGYGDRGAGGGDPATTYSGPGAAYGGPGAGYGDQGGAYAAGPGAGYGDQGAAYAGPGAGHDEQAAGYDDRGAGYDDRGAGYDDRGAGYVAGASEYGDAAATQVGALAAHGGPAVESGGPGAGYADSAAGRDERARAAAGGMYDGPPRVEWVSADETAVAGGAMIDLSAPRGLPVNHRGRERRRRGIVVAAALGAVLAGGVGYAAVHGLGLDGSTTHKNAEVPLVTLAPTTDPALPDDSPSIGIPDSASASASAARTNSPSPSVSASSTTPVTRTTTPGPGNSGVAVIPTPTPTRTNSPHVIQPSPPVSATSTGSASALTARFSQVSNSQGIVGSVTVNNPGTGSADWTVQVTIPGATQVAVATAGVSGHISGGVATFSGPSIDGGGSFAFSFVASGTLSGSASGCSVNGSACN